MSNSLLPKYNFWLEKECLSREIQFLMASLTLSYLPGRLFKDRLHQLEPTAFPRCEHEKHITMAREAPSLCGCQLVTASSFSVPLLNNYIPLSALFIPGGFPPSAACNIAQTSAKWLMSSLCAAGLVLGRDGAQWETRTWYGRQEG